MTSYPINPEFSDTPTFYKRDSWSREEFRTDILSAEDWRGNRFAVGDEVMYCIGAGRGQMMAIGVVRQIRGILKDTGRYEKNPSDPDGRAVWTVTGHYWDLEVQVLTTKTSGSWDNKQRTKPAWVNPMNITALKF